MIRFAKDVAVAYASAIKFVLQAIGAAVFYDERDLLCRTSSNGATNEHYLVTQYGLRLPDGRVVWPPDEYKGYPLDTAAQRGILLKVLQKSAGELSFLEKDFLLHYSWVRRSLAINVKEEGKEDFPIDSSAAFMDETPPSPDGTDDGNRDQDEASNDSKFHARHL